jgi:hypothetical protein
MAKNLQAGLRQSKKASREAGLTGDGVFSRAPLDLRFAMQKTLDPRITFTRASSATFVGSDGLIQTATTNEPRFDHNPTTGESLGLLVEEARTNLLLNSATLSTQSVTVAAAANTLSFYGTGTVTLTGVSTAGPLVGTGANNRVSLTFTPTVGVLILTVSGSVTNAQLEAGSFPTSYIPTTSATVTRAADVASITGSAFSSWYRQDEGTLFAEGSGLTTTPRWGSFNSVAAFSECINFGSVTGGLAELTVRTPTTTTAVSITAGNTLQAGAIAKDAFRYAVNDFAVTRNGVTPSTSTSGNLPNTRNTLYIGVSANTFSYHNGHIRRLTYWPVRLSNTSLQSITQP